MLTRPRLRSGNASMIKTTGSFRSVILPPARTLFGRYFLYARHSMAGQKIQSTTDAGSLNTFGRNEIEVAPISSALLRIACLVILYKTCGVQKLPGGSFSYDTLILAVGSRANDFGTPGVTENCHFIDDIGQALLFSDRLRSRILIAIAARTDLHLVIV